LLKGFNLRLVVADITPAVLNVMQMTQLENLLPLFLTLEQFEESLDSADEEMQVVHEEQMDFSFEVQEVTPGEKAVCTCRGYMSFSNEILKLQDALEDYRSFVLDFTQVGYIDTRVLILLSDLAEEHFVEISGASNVLIELFEEHHLEEKFKIT
jgi:anti-anti-sigma regulatory factor